MPKFKIATFLAWQGCGLIDISPQDTLKLAKEYDAVLIEVNWGNEEDHDHWTRIFTEQVPVYEKLFKAMKSLSPMEIDNKEQTSNILLAFNMRANFLQVSDILAAAGHRMIGYKVVG